MNSLPQKPRFKNSLRVRSAPPDGVFIVSENGVDLLEGEAYRLICPLIDGSRNPDQIVDEVGVKLPAAEAYYALLRLQKRGYLTEGESLNGNPQAMAFWELVNLDAGAIDRLAVSRVRIDSFEDTPAEPLRRALRSLGLSESTEDVPIALAVAMTPDYFHPKLKEYDKRQREKGMSWVPFKPVGRQIWLGPLLRPEEGKACWRCLIKSLQTNRSATDYLRRLSTAGEPVFPPHCYLPTTLQAACSLAATVIALWIADSRTAVLEDCLMVVDLGSLQIDRHPLRKWPNCDCCGAEQPPTKAPFRWTPTSRRKEFTTDGGHRVEDPRRTLLRHLHLISPLTGLVGALQPMHQPGMLTPVYAARTATPGPNVDLNSLKGRLKNGSAGKGLDDATAQVGALGEAAERYSGMFQGDEPRRKASFRELGADAVHPDDCLNFSPLQYQERTRINSHCDDEFNWIPHPFDEKTEIEWTPAWSLTEKSVRYLPTAFCYYGYPFPDSKPFCRADSNGCAAGNNLEEAFLQAFMELAERDAIALWWYNRIARPGVELGSFPASYLPRLQDSYRALGREVWVVDLVNDLGIPAFAALSRRIDKTPEEILFGFGAHFDCRIALSRALTELSQIVVAVPADQEINSQNGFEPALIRWLEDASLESQPYLAPDPDQPSRRFEDYPTGSCEDLRDDVWACVEIARGAGLETLVLDQTRGEIGLNVVRVVVPGMRHFWRRTGPGRLYDVPVELGWLDSPLSESELNPIPIFV